MSQIRLWILSAMTAGTLGVALHEVVKLGVLLDVRQVVSLPQIDGDYTVEAWIATTSLFDSGWHHVALTHQDLVDTHYLDGRPLFTQSHAPEPSVMP